MTIYPSDFCSCHGKFPCPRTAIEPANIIESQDAYSALKERLDAAEEVIRTNAKYGSPSALEYLRKWEGK